MKLVSSKVDILNTINDIDVKILKGITNFIDTNDPTDDVDNSKLDNWLEKQKAI